MAHHASGSTWPPSFLTSVVLPRWPKGDTLQTPLTACTKFNYSAKAAPAWYTIVLLLVCAHSSPIHISMEPLAQCSPGHPLSYAQSKHPVKMAHIYTLGSLPPPQPTLAPALVVLTGSTFLETPPSQTLLQFQPSHQDGHRYPAHTCQRSSQPAKAARHMHSIQEILLIRPLL